MFSTQSVLPLFHLVFYAEALKFKSRYSWNQADRQAAAVLLHNCACLAKAPAIPASQSVGFTSRMANEQNSFPFAAAGPAARARLAMVIHTVCIWGATGSWRAGRGKKESLLWIVLCRELASVHFIVHGVYGPHLSCNKRSLNVSCRTKSWRRNTRWFLFPFMLRDIGQIFAMLKSEIASRCNTLLHRKPTYSNPKLFGLCWRPPAARMKTKS